MRPDRPDRSDDRSASDVDNDAVVDDGDPSDICCRHGIADGPPHNWCDTRLAERANYDRCGANVTNVACPLGDDGGMVGDLATPPARWAEYALRIGP